MPTPLGFQTRDDWNAEIEQLQVLRNAIDDTVRQVLSEFIEANWGPNTYSVDETPEMIGWYLGRPHLAVEDAPLTVTLEFMDDSLDRIPTLAIDLTLEDHPLMKRNARMLLAILQRETGIQVR